MRNRTSFNRAALAAATVVLAACGDLPTTGSSTITPPASESESLAASLDGLSTEAALAGDERAASDYADGALAIRLGAVPTEIAVIIDGQGYRYYAVVSGIVERGPTGAELLKRTLVAWNNLDRPDAILRVMSRSDAATFGRDDIVGDPGRATGTWLDIARAARFVAIEGSLATALASIGAACPNAQSDPRFACNLARFDLRMDGTFELAGDATVRLPITSEAEGISGVIVRRTDGGSGGRPGVTPSRPVPTRSLPVKRG